MKKFRSYVFTASITTLAALGIIMAPGVASAATGIGTVEWSAKACIEKAEPTARFATGESGAYTLRTVNADGKFSDILASYQVFESAVIEGAVTVTLHGPEMALDTAATYVVSYAPYDDSAGLWNFSQISIDRTIDRDCLMSQPETFGYKLAAE